jgi:hypothetical protein
VSILLSAAIILAQALLAAPAAAAPLASAFTYQGQLTIAGPTSTGPVDLQFRLFDAATGGTQIGPTITNLSATIDAQGRFTTTLDFGPTAFGPEARWLEVSVRRWPASTSPGGPGGGGGPGEGTLVPYTTLTPRTAVSPSPATLFAMSTITARGAAMFTDATIIHEFTVPEGVYAVRVDAWGAGGGTLGGGPATGASGSYARFAAPVRPGDTLRITLGTGGANASGGLPNATSGGSTIIQRRRGTDTTLLATVPGGQIQYTPGGPVYSGITPTLAAEVGSGITLPGRVSSRNGGTSPPFAGRLPEIDRGQTTGTTVAPKQPAAWAGTQDFFGPLADAGDGCVMLEF